MVKWGGTKSNKKKNEEIFQKHNLRKKEENKTMSQTKHSAYES